MVRRLVIVLALNLGLVVGLIVVGMSAHSLGVFAAGADYLADAAGIGAALLAVWLGNRPPTSRRPRGYPRATTVAALINGSWLLALSVLVMAGAAYRLARPNSHVEGLPVLIASGIAALVMLLGVRILGVDADGDGDGDDLSRRAILLDTAADAAAAGGVAVSGAVIFATGGFYWLDPVVALAIALVVAYQALHLLMKARRVFVAG